MGNKRNRRSKRLDTPSPEREEERTQVETPNTGIVTLTIVDSESQGIKGESNSELQLNEPSLISNKIKDWTPVRKEKNNYRIAKNQD